MRRAPLLSYAVPFWIVAALRLLSAAPFVIDDDEAWWSSAATAMKFPWNFYRSAVDHKPPGVVWFYWIIHQLTATASDPRVVRVVYVLMTVAAAAVLGRMVSRSAAKAQGWLAATLFLILSAIPTPKLLAVTADGLIVNLTIFGYGLALLGEFPGVSVAAGILLGLALLIKQTAVFFCLPILLATRPKRWSIQEILGFALGSLLVVVPSILAVGADDFLYWTWTYPKEVLTSVREQLFHSTFEMLQSLVMFALAILPLLVRAVRREAASGLVRLAIWKLRLRDFRLIWFGSGLAAALLGKGLFLHYLLLFVPPVALFSAELLEESQSSAKGTLAWIGSQYAAGILILLIPSAGTFWGTDLSYFSGLGRVVKASLRPGERAMIWGGSALPLTYAGASHATRFVLPRFAVAPYATSITREIFHRELESDVPALILDLHERSDNQFNNPLESEPFVFKMIQDLKYSVYVSQAVPWAKFYFRNPPPESAGLIELKDPQGVKASYEPFPRDPHSWMRLVELARQEGPSRVLKAEWGLRASASLELLERQGRTEQVRAKAKVLGKELRSSLANETLGESMVDEIRRFIAEEEKAAGVLIVPNTSPFWWPTVAMVELQPRAMR